MKKFPFARQLVSLLILLAACTPSHGDEASPVPTLPPPTATASATPVPPTATATASATPIPPTATATPVPPTATTPSTPTPTSPPDDLWLGPDDVRLHPDGDRFYSGDQISFQVYAHHGSPDQRPDVDLEVRLGPPDGGELIARGPVRFYGRAEGQVRLDWAWDTAGLSGTYSLTFALDPDDQVQVGDENPHNNVVSLTLELAPPLDTSTRWAEAHSDCCTFYYITGSAAERDLPQLIDTAQEAIDYVSDRLGEEISQTLPIYFIDRVLGHGGFAGEVVILSYLDRNYAGGGLREVFRHEGVHLLDQRFTDARPTLLIEGLAVTIAGGHFDQEPITERAAALLALDRYIPLEQLAADFYPSQHEIGYLEAAAFVTYLIERYGWEDFKAFYSDIHWDDAGQVAMIETGLQAHFGLSLAQAEADWLASLEAITPSPTQITDLRDTVAFYDTVRRYQQIFDPSAYFLQAWLPSLPEARRRGITADFDRHPESPVNLALETMLIDADQAFGAGDYAWGESLLAAVNATLDTPEQARQGDFVDPLAAQYLSIVQAVAEAGYETEQIDLIGNPPQGARVRASADGEWLEVELAYADDQWQLAQ